MNRRFDALTSLRFVAAVMVLFGHLEPWAGRLGSVAVPFFFVLSGFVLFHADEHVPAGWFYWKRFTKLAPLYYLSLALSARTAIFLDPNRILFNNAKLGKAFVINAAFLGGWLPDWLWLNPPGWTLSAEACFYLLFPMLALLVRRLPRGYLVPALALNFCFGAALLAAVGGGSSFLDFAFTSPLQHLGEFICGLLLSRAYQEWPERFPSALLLPAGAAFALALAFLLPAPAEAALRTYALTPAFALMIWGAARVRKGWLTSRGLVALGEASYALYVFHWPIIELVRSPKIPAHVFTMAMLIAMPLVSVIAHRYVEIPVRAALRTARRPGTE